MRTAFLLVVGVILAVGSVVIRSFPPGSRPESATTRTMTIGSHSLRVWVADTPETITLGLGQRDAIGSDGMLFVLGERTIPTFWMKGMRFGLDFIWIDGAKVVDLTRQVPAQPGVVDADLVRYSPRFPVTHVLEIPAGMIDQYGIQIGDSLSF